MYSLTYGSSAIQHFSTLELQELLSVSRANNEQRGVTGMLLYKGGNFIQVLEGERETVAAVIERIKLDRRHHGVITLLSRDIETRQFPGWSMAFRDLDDRTGSKGLAGYDDFLNTPLNDRRFIDDAAACQKLLSIFKRLM